MAFTVRGIGAMHYGKRDFRPDGSYVTTLWFVVAYVPIVPIQSKRWRSTGQTKFYGLGTRRTYVLIEKTKPHLQQVLSTYAFFAVEVALFIAAMKLDNWWLALPGLLLLGVPFLLRKRAHEEMKAQSERVAMGFSPEVRD
jgi:hypothetical protein